MVGKTCCIKYCYTSLNTDLTDNGLSYHSFPKTTERRKMWLDSIKGNSGPITKHSVVCSAHFKPNDFKIWHRRILHKNAVPSIIPVIENNMAYYISQKVVEGKIKIKKDVVPHKFKCQEQEGHSKTCFWKNMIIGPKGAFCSRKDISIEEVKTELSGKDYIHTKRVNSESEVQVVEDVVEIESNNDPLNDGAPSDSATVFRDYVCNLCQQTIIDYRYVCVQCADYDLCVSCETKMLHKEHYVLRVPPGKIAKEVRIILEALRRELRLLHPESELTIEPVAVKTECSINEDDWFDDVHDGGAAPLHDEVPDITGQMAAVHKEPCGESVEADNAEMWLDVPLLEIHGDTTTHEKKPQTNTDNINHNISVKRSKKAVIIPKTNLPVLRSGKGIPLKLRAGMNIVIGLPPAPPSTTSVETQSKGMGLGKVIKRKFSVWPTVPKKMSIVKEPKINRNSSNNVGDPVVVLTKLPDLDLKNKRIIVKKIGKVGPCQTSGVCNQKGQYKIM